VKKEKPLRGKINPDGLFVQDLSLLGLHREKRGRKLKKKRASKGKNIIKIK